MVDTVVDVKGTVVSCPAMGALTRVVCVTVHAHSVVLAGVVLLGTEGDLHPTQGTGEAGGAGTADNVTMKGYY